MLEIACHVPLVALPENSVLTSERPAEKIVEACRRSGEITIEAWIAPTVAAQGGPARIVTMSRGSLDVNFMLAHGEYGVDPPQETFVARLRTSPSKPSGFPRLETRPHTADTRLMHVVFTRRSDGERVFYIDGEADTRDIWVATSPIGLATCR